MRVTGGGTPNSPVSFVTAFRFPPVMTDTDYGAVRAVLVRRFTDRWPTARHAPCVRWRLARSIAHARGEADRRRRLDHLAGRALATGHDGPRRWVAALAGQNQRDRQPSTPRAGGRRVRNAGPVPIGRAVGGLWPAQRRGLG